MSTTGAPECRAACTTLAPDDGFACVSGAQVACAYATSGDCHDCGCDPGEFCSDRTASSGMCLALVMAGGSCERDVECDAGMFCSTLADTNGTCVAPRATGQSCLQNSQCASGNCSAPTTAGVEGYCQPAEGELCDTTNCTSCRQYDPYGSGTRCAQSCKSDADCGTNEHCLGSSVTKQYWCRQECFAICTDLDWNCTYPSVSSDYSVCLP